MRKIIVFVLAIILYSTQFSYAHAPSRVEASYDPETSEVSVMVYHDVKDPKTHYIKNISVFVNDVQVLQDEYSQQSNNMDQPAVYELRDLKSGDKVTVKASCSISGQNSTTLTI
jgi:desulfoferrodoxin (superoxide reductase-like protein)